MLRCYWLFFFFSACVEAGVIIELVPTPPPEPWWEENWSYGGNGQLITVEIFARLDSNSPQNIQLRSMRFDLANSSPYFQFFPLIIHPDANPPISFWNFASTAACQDPAECGRGYTIDDSLALDDILFIEYLGDKAVPAELITLDQTSFTPIGILSVQLGYEPGIHLLDLVNHGAGNSESGASVTYGFGGPGDPMGEFNVYNSTLTGGSVWVADIPEPATLALLGAGLAFVSRRRLAWSGS